MIDDSSIILKCECHSEAMEVTYDSEFKQFWFSYWGYGFSNKKVSLFRRLKFAFRLILKGTLHKDFLILDEDKAKQLVDFINQNKKQVL